jgi:UDP-N-acetylglucosamine 2-epimerase (non-hydrolysing)/UDP-GlcNAc:undecaprenyl-phosphate GlcNAc-1-phosphate transferase
MKKILFIFGTRPEGIKLAPIILEVKKSKKIKAKICITSQHRLLLDEVLSLFKIKADYDLNLMKDNQRLDQLHASALLSLEKVLEKEKPHLVIVQGDTTSAFCGAIASFYKKIPIAHIEAGLRSFDKYRPFPEEVNRRLISVLSDYHFCPTKKNKENLLKEGINSKSIFVVGNTVLDALRIIVTCNEFKPDTPSLEKIDFSKRIILITLHRRENWQKMPQICSALKKLAKYFVDDLFIFPAHPNPYIRKIVKINFSKIKNFIITSPLNYKNFILLMKNSYLIITDSGGIQEEAPSLNKPVLVLRDKTERPEIIKIGAAKLIGTDKKNIFYRIKRVLENEGLYKKMINKRNPYGDGFASERIINVLEKRLHF